MKISINKYRDVFILIVLFVFYIAGISFTGYGNVDVTIRIISILGLIEFIYCIYDWHRVSGQGISLYSIFIMFAFLFNFGQCFMWAIGIHADNELGQARTFGVLISKQGIIYTQLLTIVGLFSFHTGAVCVYKPYRKKEAQKKANLLPASWGMKVISILALCVGTVSELLQSLTNIIITRTYGYGANLYNANIVMRQNNILILTSWLFYPAIYATLLAYNYKSYVVKICYSLILVDCIMQTFGGDRAWVYNLAILLWMHHRYYTTINFKRFIACGIIGIFVLYICVTLRSVRQDIITLSSLINATQNGENPFKAALFEMGNSMAPAAIILDRGATDYPYGNTYLLALCGMVTERLITLFIPQYISVGTWFSQVYLKLRYGAGFSMIAEALINYGPYFSIIVLGIMGVLVSKFINKRTVDFENPMTAFLTISTTNALVLMTRNTLISSLKFWMFSTVSIYVAILITDHLRRWRGRNR